MVDRRYGPAVFRLLEESNHNKEVILDSGVALTWLRVVPTTTTSPKGRTFQFGSVLKQRDPLVDLMIYPHVVYAKLLLTSAVRNHVRREEEEEEASK